MNFLGHRSIKNTLIYIQFEEAIFKDEDDKFICKVAKTVEEAKTLIEIGFNYVCELNEVKLFRKRQSGVGVSKSGVGGIWTHDLKLF